MFQTATRLTLSLGKCFHALSTHFIFKGVKKSELFNKIPNIWANKLMSFFCVKKQSRLTSSALRQKLFFAARCPDLEDMVRFGLQSEDLRPLRWREAEPDTGDALLSSGGGGGGRTAAPLPLLHLNFLLPECNILLILPSAQLCFNLHQQQQQLQTCWK